MSDPQTLSPDSAPQEPPEGSGPAVDPTLLAETLGMTPEERLLLNDRLLRTIQDLRRGFGQE